MFFLTNDQKYVMSVLEETRFLRIDQVCRLLAKLDEGKDAAYGKRLILQLRNMNHVYLKTEEVVSLRYLKDEEIDLQILAAVDVMLDLHDGRKIVVSSKKPPFTLSFLIELRDGKLKAFGIIPAAPGEEEILNFKLSGYDSDITVVFLISDMGQCKSIQTTLKHFFTIQKHGKRRYFKGTADRNI